MATFDYARARQTADRLLKKFGQTGAIRRTETTGGNGYDPESGTETTTDYDCTLAVLEYSGFERDGTLILSNDRKVYVSAAGIDVEPKTTDKIIIADKPYESVNVKPLSPAGTVVYFEIQARG